MLVHGWGRFPKISAQLSEPASPDSLLDQLRTRPVNAATIPRGAGRSYGDSALGPHIMSSRHLDSLLAFDTENGLLHCGAGLTLDQLLQVCIPKGWFPAVVPGTKFVSIGGAIAASVGKRLLDIAKSAQVLVVTHSPQVASCGAHHWRVSKLDCDEQGITRIEILDDVSRNVS